MAAKLHIHTMLNGEPVEFLCEPRQSLLEVLRETLGLTGTKEGCSNGNCGACSVLLDGVLVNSCLVLAPEVESRSVLTIEGLAPPGELHLLQRKFIEHAALQCGVCTPGFILAAKALLDRNPDMVYCHSQAQHYAWVAEDDPALFVRITELVAEGRWEPVGGMWVETDLNLPDGESLLRQMVQGQRAFEGWFGRRCDAR